MIRTARLLRQETSTSERPQGSHLNLNKPRSADGAVQMQPCRAHHIKDCHHANTVGTDAWNLCLLRQRRGAAQPRECFTDPVGGTGGQQHISRCPAGTVVTGVAALTGAYINNIPPICNGRTMPGAGGKGERRSASCPAGSVVDTIDLILLRSPNHLVKALQLFCHAPGTRLQTARVSLDTAPYVTLRRVPGYPGGTMDCTNQHIVGLQGRAGAAVDALGLICSAAPGKP